MYIEQEFDIENTDERIAEADEIVTLVSVPETEENWQEKLKTQSPILDFVFWHPLRTRFVTSSWPKTSDKSRFGVKMGCENSEYGL